MAWFRKKKFTSSESSKNVSVPKGLLTKCPGCQEMVSSRDFQTALYVCPLCNYHGRITARQRILYTCDPDSFEEIHADLESEDIIGFVDTLPYPVRLEKAIKKTGEKSAILTGKAKLDGREIMLGVMDFFFLGGSMGRVVGEKIALLFEKASEMNLPVIIFSASGGARMQEGIMSLMQLSKTTFALEHFQSKGGLYISVLTDPTFGGTTASFASLGDIIFAEPEALIGFAGPRVIEQTIRQKLPPKFQRAQFLMEHGFIDRIVERSKMKEDLGKALGLLLSGEYSKVSGQK